ncbi:fluoride efflux transporter FluC [Macrococcus lamae]|nr:CrcB family protein [Macrococcus lamae]
MKYLHVCLFAFIGGVLRYEMSMLFNPAGTFLVNLIGAFLLGLLTVKLKEMTNNDLRTGITGGLIGSFTTFSTFSMESVELLQTDVLIGVMYISATLLLGIMLAAAGMKFGEVLS